MPKRNFTIVKLPVFKSWYGWDVCRVWGRTFGFWLGPFPEQVEGEEVHALIYFECRFRFRPDFRLSVRLRSDDRMEFYDAAP